MVKVVETRSSRPPLKYLAQVCASSFRVGAFTIASDFVIRNIGRKKPYMFLIGEGASRLLASMNGTGFFKESLRALNWAVYLGCSWTWCIGMFLPVILVSEFGNVAWFVFAIPNVIGAAAMGWTLSRPGTSQQIVADHRAACVAFSAVTLGFHLFFLYWLWLQGCMPLSFALIGVAAGIIFGFLARRKIGLDFLLGWLVLAISLTVLGRGLMHPVWGVAHPLEAPTAIRSMLGLAPICVLGFLLCPYLDVTFHRARQSTPPRLGKAAFALGFGVVFLSMILLTLLYSGDFALDQNEHDHFGSFGRALLITWVALHIASQAGFTFAAHIRALPRPKWSDLLWWSIAALLVWLAIFAIRQEEWFSVKGFLIAMQSGDLMYRLFMSFYGLVFPAYVWICMVPIFGKAARTFSPRTDRHNRCGADRSAFFLGGVCRRVHAVVDPRCTADAGGAILCAWTRAAQLKNTSDNDTDLTV